MSFGYVNLAFSIASLYLQGLTVFALMYAAIQDFEKRLLFLQIEPHIWLYRKNLKKFWVASFSTKSNFRQIFEKFDFGLKKACYSDIRFRFIEENAF